ncbi:MAG: hypothetical protein GYB68_04515 [Chloroflexi bacterium]|nr:hypothetical protein [Chloroflexota bacterium]
MTKTENFAQVEIESVAQLRAWLEANHMQAESVWLVTFKKHIADKYVSTSEVLDEILCFGWIDGIRRKLDGDRTMQLIAPRQTQYWAKSYKERVARLEREGRMHPAGLATIEASKRNGLWGFMDDVDALILPDDLIEALQSHPPAAENFDASAPSYRRNVLRWIKLAKADSTRAKRIDKAVDFAARNEKIPQM